MAEETSNNFEMSDSLSLKNSEGRNDDFGIEIGSKKIIPQSQMNPSRVNVTSRLSRRRTRRKEKFDVSRLPTPPPDPIPPDDSNIFEEAFARHRNRLEAETLRKEGEFLDYLMRLPTPNENQQPAQLSQPASVFAASLEAEDAFDHLDRLYTLMEQVLSLREQNSKLARRVRELEHLRVMNDAHQAAERAIIVNDDSPIPEEDTTMAESLLSAMLSADYDHAQKKVLRPPVPRQRSRSVGVEGTTSLLHEIPLYRQISSKRRSSGVQGTPKVSKWTKVKAAFKWERAYTGGINDSDITRYLKVPESPVQECNFTATISTPTPTPTPPTPGTLSSASSAEDIDGIGRGTASNSSIPVISRGKDDLHRDDIEDITTNIRQNYRPLVGDRAFSGSNPFSTHMSKLENCRSKISTTNQSTQKCSVNLPTTSVTNRCADLAVRRQNPALTITVTVPSNEELRGTTVSSPDSVSPSRSPESFDSNLQECSASSQARQTPTETEPRQEASNSNEIFKRQYSAKGESLRCSPQMQRHNSKWSKVKKAFLAGSMSVPPSPSRATSFFTELDGLESDNASVEDLDDRSSSSNIQAEIQRNYHILHKKLSVEFYAKYAEWEKLKSSTHATDSVSQELSNSPSRIASKGRDAMRLQLMGKDQLSPDFKKKLEEWKRIKKGYHSPSGEHPTSRRRFTDWQLWRSPSKPETKSDGEQSKPHLSEDFIKKMEEWKRIRAGQFDDEHYNNISNKNSSNSARSEQRKSVCTSDFRQSKMYKPLEGMGFHCLDKDLNKIEREPQKVERQREKLLDREARLSKLRRVVGSSPQKKEVLVQTATGFFRFEGISRKFTRKLYEWEKSQGISAESSTFRLLNSGSRLGTNLPSTNVSYDRGMRCTMKRSKSVGSMVEEGTKMEAPIRQPSSLSLNDVEELEAKCMADSRISSEHTIPDSTEEMAGALDDYEPEAIIVDIEDVIEETASPLTNVQPHQTPIYSVATSETTSIAVPLGTVTSSHQASPVRLVEAGESYPLVAKGTFNGASNENSSSTRSPCIYLEGHRSESALQSNKDTRQSVEQRVNVGTLSLRASEFSRNERTSVDSYCDAEFTDLPKTDSIDDDEMSNANGSSAAFVKGADDPKTKNTNDGPSALRWTTSETNPELQESIINSNAATTELLSQDRANKSQMNISTVTKIRQTNNDLKTSIKYGSSNSSDLMKEQSVTCQVSSPRKVGHVASLKIQSNPEWNTLLDATDNRVTVENQPREPTDSTIQQIYTDKTISAHDSGESGYSLRESQIESHQLPTSAFSDNVGVERIVINENTLDKIVVRTAVNESRTTNIHREDAAATFSCTVDSEMPSTTSDCISKKEKIGPRNVFVKTTRMIFSPFRREGKGRVTDNFCNDGGSQCQGEVVRSVENNCARTMQESKTESRSPLVWRKKMEENEDKREPSSRRPPLPQSPVLSRKEYHKINSPKDASSSIKMMIQRYNKKLDETGSPASSGSASPIWRSPTSERRVKSRTEKYLIETKKAVLNPSRNEITKCSSAGAIRTSRKNSPTVSTDANTSSQQPSGVLKSPSADSVSTTSLSCTDQGQGFSKRYSPRSNEPRKLLNVNESRCGRLSPALIHKLTTLSVAAAMKEGSLNSRCSDSSSHSLTHETSDKNHPTNVTDFLEKKNDRALKIKEAKENFLSFGPGFSIDSKGNSNSDVTESDRMSSCRETPVRLDLIKSASAGMINVDVDTFERLSMDRGCESLPRPSKRSGESTSRFTNIASKFRRARLRRGKDKDSKMTTISMLCRQSLLVDIQGDETTKSCPSTPAPQRDDEECSWTSRT